MYGIIFKFRPMGFSTTKLQIPSIINTYAFSKWRQEQRKYISFGHLIVVVLIILCLGDEVLCC